MHRFEHPFRHAIIKNFLPAKDAKRLEAALRRQKFIHKEADLFSFSQTSDLLRTKDPAIKKFLKLLKSKEFTARLHKLLEVKTKQGKVDAAGFRYTDTDYLLCHDDGVSSRRVAYIYHLSRNFTAKDGGALALRASHDNIPSDVAKRITPAWNSLVVFSVTKKSHHEVEEVLSAKERLTIAGWFHA